MASPRVQSCLRCRAYGQTLYESEAEEAFESSAAASAPRSVGTMRRLAAEAEVGGVEEEVAAEYGHTFGATQAGALDKVL
jgi:hypothetical protein